LVRIAEEERDADEQARVAMVAAEKVRRVAKNKAMLERQQAEDEYELSEIDADEVLEEAGVDPQALRDRLVTLRGEDEDGGSSEENEGSLT